uniref:PKS/mFAS DH domain-containing protein n=1 Tax=Bionectria ochroleuca TaxID=29856 RepID=A0A8H7KBJ5_BIOOC
MSVDLPEEKMRQVIASFGNNHASIPYVACVSSPVNVTISGDERDIDDIQVILASEKVRTTKLRTGVAYHSPHMRQIASKYAESIGDTDMEEMHKHKDSPVMISSVTGKYVDNLGDLRAAQYWVNNLLSTVQFSQAGTLSSLSMAKKQRFKFGTLNFRAEDIVELGPHPALRRPVADCLRHNAVPEVSARYHGTLSRQVPTIESLLKLAGELYTRGHSVDIRNANQIGRGAVRAISWPTCLRIPSITRGATGMSRLYPDIPAFDQRVCMNFSVFRFPTGILSSLGGETGYWVRDAIFQAPISINKTKRAGELHMCLMSNDKAMTTLEFRIYSASSTRWFQNYSGSVQILYNKEGIYSGNAAQDSENQFYRSKYARAVRDCTSQVPTDKLYGTLRSNGLGYGPSFQPLDNLAWDGKSCAVGRLRCFGWGKEYLKHDLRPHVVHPTLVDGAGQLPFIGYTNGGTDLVFNGTAVTRIRDAWFASSGLSYPDTSYLQAFCSFRLKGLRGTDSCIYALDGTGNIILRISHVETTAVGGDETALAAEASRKICFAMSGHLKFNGPNDNVVEEARRELYSQATLSKQVINYLNALSYKHPHLKVLELGPGAGP